MRMTALLAAVLAAIPLSRAEAKARLEVRLDPRAHLVEIVHLLARPQERQRMVSGNGLDYAAEVLSRFGAMRGHPSVAAYREAVESGLPVQEILEGTVTGLPEGPGPAVVADDGGAMARLLKTLPDFAEASGFWKFFREHRRLYDAWRSKVTQEARTRRPDRLFEEYTGRPVDAKIVIYLCPFFHDASSFASCGPRGCRVDTFWGPAGGRAAAPDFDFRDRGPVLWHELAHFVLDPLSEINARRIRSLEPRDFDADSCHGSWEQCVREVAAQSVADRMVDWSRRTRGLREGEPLRHDDIEELSAKVQRRLADYESRRARYPTIVDFYPEMLDALKD